MKFSRPCYRLTCLLLGLLLFIPVHAQEFPLITRVDPPKSILFTGNSFTFYNNAIYSHLRKLLVAEDPSTRKNIFLKSMTISGAVLSDHRGGLIQMLDSRQWDVIVLQGHSREAIDADMAPAFESASREFSETIRSTGAEPVLFMTWAYSDHPEMTINLVNSYTQLGNKLNILVIPVGLAFEQASRDIPGVVLHQQDRIHPSIEGTYLAAAVFYAALYGKSPLNLDYQAGLDETLARKLRQAAWQAVLKYYRVTKDS